MKAAHCLAMGSLLLFFGIGRALAQSNDGLVVIKKGDNYLAHVKNGEGEWELQNATDFGPNCLWYTGPHYNHAGTNHNYYFMDDNGTPSTADDFPRFLAAPLAAGEGLYLSTTVPETHLLGNTDQPYYFYDWDSDSYGKGIARGHQYVNATTREECTACGGQWENTASSGEHYECWEVYWVGYDDVAGEWKMSDYYYNLPEEFAARSRWVTATEHETEIRTITSGGLTSITVPATMESGNSEELSASISSLVYTYIPAYTEYAFEGGIHYYYNSSDHDSAPGTSSVTQAASSYLWEISGAGASYLEFDDETLETPMLTYSTPNNDGDKEATITLTVTYPSGATQTCSATVTVKTPCQNPSCSANVTYEGVIISWPPTATKYKLEWTLASDDTWTSSSTLEDITETSHTLTDLEYNTAYQYRVMAYCSDAYLEPTTSGTFTTKAEPQTLVYGAVFGGGRMADVGGKTEVVIINCEEINAVYGGNDIAGRVQHADGSTIVLGVNTGDDYDTYGTTNSSIGVHVGSVYGGGNGYYTYDGHNPGVAIGTTYHADGQFTESVTDVGGSTVYMTSGYIPTISKTAITVNNEHVKVDTIFGGAKNAFITADSDHGTSITFNNGTAFAVFGGNNYGGTQAAGSDHYINVTGTTTNLTPNPTSTATIGYGRDFGIRYLFGGGNKVAGNETDILIQGGQCDTIFGGGNSADVAAAHVTVNCSMEAGSSYTFGHTYTNAITEYAPGTPPTLTINTGYEWDGTGVYNVRTLFGGNNQADMAGLPTITLTSGSVGTVYGGGNAGDMLAQTSEDPGNPIATDFGNPAIGTTTYDIYYSTHVVMDQATMLVDNLYGGCQMSNVDYSTWVEIKNGHVGTVYGGCNISGDVGSNSYNPYGSGPDPTYEENQYVYGATYVKASGGTIYKNLFAGSNGRYHCNDGIYYIEEGIDYADPEHYYIRLSIPTHNETHVMVSTGATVKGNVYAGGNMAPVGFTDYTSGVAPSGKQYPRFLGLASVRMSGGTVEGDVYGGGNMASIYGSNEVKVTGGTILGALYGGNDQAGQVAQMSNRVFPAALHYDVASDGYTSLAAVHTYVSITGKPRINTVYGGGNGAYSYTTADYCDVTDKPIQSTTFVDININGSDTNPETQAHIDNVFGGGNGVTVTGGITVFLNVDSPATYDHVDNIFGGNNQGDLSDVLPDIILLKGQVHNVYGGCNQGAMVGSFSVDNNTYTNVGSMVRLRETYDPDGDPNHLETVSAKVTNAVYGGCRMNGVTNNSLVLVEGGTHSNASIFGGSDISGDVAGTSRVVVTGGTVDNVYGGGNGYYDYNSGTYEGLTPPFCKNSQVDMQGGTVNNLFGGGYAGECGTTTMNVSNGTVNESVYGGGNMAGVTTSHNLTVTTINAQGEYVTTTSDCTTDGSSTVNLNGGTLKDDIFGGCNVQGNVAGNIQVNVNCAVGVDGEAAVNVFGGGEGHQTSTSGNVEVNIDDASACVYGDVYGGSGYGNVNSGASNTTTVNVLNGAIRQTTISGDTYGGNVYGGGLGDNDYPAAVKGKVYVNIGAGDFTDPDNPVYSGDAIIEGAVYGCNNVNGSPKDDVFVNVYATNHSGNNTYPSPSPTTVAGLNALGTTADYFALSAVYGGGNLADYEPSTANKSTTVHVYACDNTIRNVFGGGNAADVGTTTTHANTNVFIEGGRIQRVIGGGNGEDTSLPAADIHGNANTTVYAGLINEIYGGANIQGSVDDDINLLMSNPNNSSLSNCTDEVYGSVFGCANAAPYNKSVTTTVLCGVGEIGELYGGSNQASIGNEENHDSGVHVTLNLYGGTYDKVFAGSKGVAGVSPVPAPIYGDVTLNLYGGTVNHAFGGSDANGNITGNITVNVLDFEANTCGLNVTNIYGASNLTPYAPDDVASGPVINVMHIKQDAGISGNVYGGGNQAPVTSNPQVNIGYDAATMSDIVAATSITYPTTSTFYTVAPRAYVSGNVFGGGNEAGVTGNPVVNMRDQGTVVTGIYGGCNSDGEVGGDINVNIYGGTLGTSSTPMTDGIFGGGKGSNTETSGHVTVTIGDGTTPEIYADVYGGSALGEVGATDKNAKVNLKNGTVHGNLFGGGMGDGSHSAIVSGNTQVVIEGGTVANAYDATETNVYGGCNTHGTVVGNITVEGTGGTVTNDVFGGGKGNLTATQGNVTVTIDGATISRDVYGGSALGQVNDDAADLTKVWFKSGIITRNLYGGGMGQDGQPTYGQVNGSVEVLVNGGTVTNVFGCNNLNGAPQSSVTVNINETTSGSMIINGNVYGGGNQATYGTAGNNYPVVNLQNGLLSHDVFGGGLGDSEDATKGVVTGNPQVIVNGADMSVTGGIYGGGSLAPTNGNPLVKLTNGATTNLYGGGKAANVTGDPTVRVEGGTVSTGIYGGNNESGTVTGNTTVTLTGGTIGASGTGNTANIHGGGYGQPTTVTGNVTVNFGEVTYNSSNEEIHTSTPLLYGDVYGGSALGNINTDNSNTTTVNILNGQIEGDVYGGGLGQKDGVNGTGDIEAKVWGIVHVNIGAAPSTDPTGMASLINSNVYGCNNLNGSPQQDVYVDVYKTNHIQTDEASYIEEFTRTYAIRNVFGGGNRSNYEPDDNPSWAKRTHNFIHTCDNTVKNVYGGGNASDCDGVELTVDGGRFNFVFAGGNGQVTAANVGQGGAIVALKGGLIGWYFEGCDMQGRIEGTVNETIGCSGDDCCDEAPQIEKYYFGANQATIYEGLDSEIKCDGHAFNFTYVYAGSRLATIYGDIKLTVKSGTIGNLFGGSEGSADISANVKKYPVNSEDINNFPSEHRLGLTNHLAAHPEDYGKGGNIYLTLEGGDIGNVFGGCDLHGLIEGEIIITVDSTQTGACALDIDNIYGGNNLAGYSPTDPTIVSPRVLLLNGHVNYDIFGGSKGDDNAPDTKGTITSNPKVVIGDLVTGHKALVGKIVGENVYGDVFGGGSSAQVEGNTKVVLKGKTVNNNSTTTILNNVYGGGKRGTVTGNTDVEIMATTNPMLFFTQLHGKVTVTNGGNPVSSGDEIAPGTVLNIVATHASGYRFAGWTVTGGTVGENTSTTTFTFTGTSDATLKANFVLDE